MALAEAAEGAQRLEDLHARGVVRALTQLYTWNPKAMEKYGATFELIYDLTGRRYGQRYMRSLLVRVGAREVGPDVWAWPPPVRLGARHRSGDAAGPAVEAGSFQDIGNYQLEDRHDRDD